MPSPIVIAIDGPSASGKSTCARRVAQHFNFIYVDTGAMYRTLAWHCLKNFVDLLNDKAVAMMCKKWNTNLVCENKQVKLLVAGYDPEKEIRTAEVSEGARKVATNQKVREWMKQIQQSCAQFGHLVMEGRDIGTAIFPESDFKFFLDAPLAERQARRWADGIREDLARRDKSDSERATNPLMIPLGAVVVNNAGLSAEATAQQIIDAVQKKMDARKNP